MENRANYAIVGLFTLAVLAGIFGFVLWFTRAADTADRKLYRVVFVGSVSGLSRGAAVRFNGLRVGEVTAIQISPSDPGRVIALIAVDNNTPVKADTKSRLESQGLTGVASVQLTGGSGSAPDLVSVDPQAPATLFADRSDFQDILETIQRLSGKIDTVLTRADSILQQGEGSILSTLRNVEAFSQALGDNSSNIASFLSNVGEMSQRVGALSSRIEKFVDEAEAVTRSVDIKAVNQAVGNFASFSEALAGNRDVVGTLLADASALAKQLQGSGAKLDTTLEDIGRLARSIDAEKINRTVDGAEKFAAILGKNADSVDRSIREITGVTDTVVRAIGRLDAVMAGAESFFGGGQDGATAGLISELSDAARSIKALASNLDARTRELSAGLQRFTGPGLRDIEALAAESRKAVNDLGRAVRTLERNPSQLLFGGQSNIPEYRR
ncbi:Ttg2C ABC-type transport system involved in resistance to organic solvents, periplasmic component [Rhabdaerophilaceae bacterium]